MYLYRIGCYPKFEYDDCLSEDILWHENKFTQEEFKQHCKEAYNKTEDSTWRMAEYLIKNKGYVKPDFQGEVDIRNW